MMENDETSLKTNANVISICLCVCTLCCVVRIIDDHTASLYLSSFFSSVDFPEMAFLPLWSHIHVYWWSTGVISVQIF